MKNTLPTYKNDLKSIANKINYYWNEPYLDGLISGVYIKYIKNREHTCKEPWNNKNDVKQRWS